MNPTARAVSRQLKAMGVAFELGVLDAHGRMLRRTADRAEVVRAIPWLRHCNAHGANVYIRPAGRLGWVLLDDLTAPTLARLAQDGFAPAVITLTSPGNYQAWIRLITNREAKPLPAKLLSLAARELASRYDADPGSADWRHFGRLAGFTNRKPRHRRGDQFPFVLLHHADGGNVARLGRDLLLQLRQPRQAQITHLSTGSAAFVGDYAHYAERVRLIDRHAIWQEDPDLSRLDFMIATIMVRQGYRPDAVYQVLTESPRVATRKAGHLHDYLQRTVTAAMG